MLLHRSYDPNAGLLRYAAVYIKLAAAGCITLALALTLTLLIPSGDEKGILAGIYKSVAQLRILCFFGGTIALILATYLHSKITDANLIAAQVRYGVFTPACGNPLHFKSGEHLPKIYCKYIHHGQYDLTIEANPGITPDAIGNITAAVSAALTRKYKQYAVVQTDTDVAGNWVTLRIEDVTADRSIIYTSVAQMHPESPTCLTVDAVTCIDLTSSGSMLIAGKTRSGKTTGVISILLQVLLAGPDDYESTVLIIDPKQAELSRLPHTVTIDEDGEGRAIITALQKYAAIITCRQQVLNQLSGECGDSVHWWDAGMHPSFVFLDEYVACRSIFPKKASKDSDYCLDTFDSLVKRIITMGASAGCYAIISIAEASVQEGGLPAMLRSAMSTKILFRPTRTEGLLLWDKEKLDPIPDRIYASGDAWFSSTDGTHDFPAFVHFPYMEFPVYRVLGDLLRKYYSS